MQKPFEGLLVKPKKAITDCVSQNPTMMNNQKQKKDRKKLLVCLLGCFFMGGYSIFQEDREKCV